MPRYEFELTLTGDGDSPEAAWDNAVEAFNEDAGPCPDTWTTDDDQDDHDEDPRPRAMDRHSIECYFCGREADERKCLPADFWNAGDGGDICGECLKLRPTPEYLDEDTPSGRFVVVCEGKGYWSIKHGWVMKHQAEVFANTCGTLPEGAHWEFAER